MKKRCMPSDLGAYRVIIILNERIDRLPILNYESCKKKLHVRLDTYRSPFG